MAVSTTVSLVLSSVFAVLLFSTMQLYRPWFASNQLNTILGGYIGSWLFVLALTAISNLETIVLGDGFQAKLFPEICFCLVGTMFACGTIHRVSATTCFLFSIFALYFVNKISQKSQNAAMPAVDAHTSSKKKRK
ncbi:protein KRTCAP2 homolog [Contarinia nasturtii]|uniref:protein KRTCAP2 homolog n=1 Tax=Contarinia nasturtii TaxID=265458 RepID=UPI0012D38984|nr:protein KRTCAP2 homolog [Contarinia nasturtii]XP_031638334.1 protein KRTCAP2 homolog [Contarinia nasturtii]